MLGLGAASRISPSPFLAGGEEALIPPLSHLPWAAWHQPGTPGGALGALQGAVGPGHMRVTAVTGRLFPPARLGEERGGEGARLGLALGRAEGRFALGTCSYVLSPSLPPSLPCTSAGCPFSLAQGQKRGELLPLTEAGFEPRSGCPKATVQLGCREGAGVKVGPFLKKTRGEALKGRTVHGQMGVCGVVSGLGA